LPKKDYLAVLSSVAGAIVVESAGAIVAESSVGVVGSVTVVESSAGVSLFPELLQATAKPAIAKTNKNFFICWDFLILFEIFQCLYPNSKKVTRVLDFFSDKDFASCIKFFFTVRRGYYF